MMESNSANGSPLDRSRSRSRSPVDEDSRRHQRSPSPANEAEPSREDRRGQITAKPSNIIGVFGLHPDTKESDLEDVFVAHGPISSCTLIYDRYTKASRGFGFVTFESVEDASRAIEACKDLVIMGRTVRVDYSKTEGAHAPTPGRYMGERKDRPTTARRPTDRHDRDRYDRRDRYDDRRGGYDRYDDRRGGYDRYDDRRGGYDRYDDRRRPARYEEDPYYGRRDNYSRPPPVAMPDVAPAYDRYGPAPPRYGRSRSPPRSYR